MYRPIHTAQVLQPIPAPSGGHVAHTAVSISFNDPFSFEGIEELQTSSEGFERRIPEDFSKLIWSDEDLASTEIARLIN